jgi:large subunit ribosomal protein L1
VPIGKVSFSRDQLVTNFRAVLDELHRVKPASAKGRYVRGVAMSSTMGPGIDVDPSRLRITDEDLAAAGAEA